MGERPIRTKRTPDRLKAHDRVASVGGAPLPRSLAWELTRAQTISYSEVVSSLRKLEKQYVGQLEGYPKFARELKRRITEKLLE